MGQSHLKPLRYAGARVLVCTFMLNTIVLAIAGAVVGAPSRNVVTTLAALLSIIPAIWVFGRRRIDAPTRIALAVTAMAFPALFVYLFDGHPWQMDMHMYFFATLAALTVLCDRRAIIVAVVVTAAHHLLLTGLAPDWVFTGGANIPRVLFHALIVVLQCVTLLWLVTHLSTLIKGKAEEAERQVVLREEAESARADTERAMAALREAQAEAERHRNVAAIVREAEEAAERRRLVADALEARLGLIVSELGRMGCALGDSRDQLLTMLDSTQDRFAQMRQSQAQAECGARTVANDTEGLVMAIGGVGRHSSLALSAAHEAASATQRLGPEIAALGDTVDAASHILSIVADVAAQTRMLAFNAALEAARCTDGTGFVVLAGEMKQLATQTGAATRQIEAQLSGIRFATESVSSAVSTATAKVRSIDDSSRRIAELVDSQIRQTGDIATATEAMTGHIGKTSIDADALEEVILQAKAAMRNTSDIATAVSARSTELDQAVHDLLMELRAA
ncbi:MAG TPA: methyl-accepting chemotaxis protein [Sphingobium sp.]|uniref:methyl-accepting chemotaxis protein n=1 Tax=Sphingobium sp. TaxID=1912891 RepID=UPI002ED1EE47